MQRQVSPPRASVEKWPSTRPVAHDAEGGVDGYHRVTLQCGAMTAHLTDHGATITHLIITPDGGGGGGGEATDVVLGYDDISDYVKDPYYMGCTVGRVANRIAGGQFHLPDSSSPNQLDVNNGPNHLHGGVAGFNRRRWRISQVAATDDAATCTMTLMSAHGDQGYLGALKVQVTFSLLCGGTLRLDYRAEMADDNQNCCTCTPVSLTNHSYFNLAGAANIGDIDAHTLHIPAGAVSRYLELNADSVPTGRVLPLSAELDFGIGRAIGETLPALDGGYDHCFVVDSSLSASPPLPLRHLATLASPATGLQMKFSSTEPAFQLYTGNYLGGEVKAPVAKQRHGGRRYGRHAGVCLEAQRFPNAVNVPQWRDSVLLHRGQVYTQRTEYSFSYVK